MASCFPEEGCALILKSGEVIPLQNIHDEKLNNFKISPQEWSPYEGEIFALVHSHGPLENYPSGNDIRGQICSDFPWGICTTDGENCSDPWFWGDDLEPPELLGRKFRHGPSGTDGKGDCYAAIRDWYKLERNILLPDFPRDWGWWTKGQNVYEDNYQSAQFRDLSTTEIKNLQIGDVFFCRLSKYVVPHHGGVYIGEGMIYHHPVNPNSWTGCSLRAPVVRWQKFVTKWVRLRDDHSLPPWKTSEIRN